MATTTTNYFITPPMGWVQIAPTAAEFLRVSGVPHSHPYYLYFGASAPALGGARASGTLTFSGGVPTAAQAVVIGPQTFTFVAGAPVNATDVQIVPATPGVGSVTFSGLPTNAQELDIGGETYTFVTVAAVPFDVEIGADEDEMAVNLVATITADSTIVTATDEGAGVVELTSILLSTTGNYTLSTAATNVAVSGATMLGGQDGSLLTAAAFTNVVNQASTVAGATETGGVVTVTADLAGALGNVTFTENASNVTISGSGALAGGTDAVEGILMCHKPFWCNIATDQPAWARVVNPVPNAKRVDGSLRLDVLATTT